MNTKTQIRLMILLVSVSIFGIVLCFPWPGAGKGTCLLHTWLASTGSLSPEEYVFPYGLIWWSAWATLALGIVRLRRLLSKHGIHRG